MAPEHDGTNRARELLTDPATGPVIRARVATWPPLTPEVCDELARLLGHRAGTG